MGLKCKKTEEGKGIATFLVQSVCEKFEEYDLYSCIDKNNIASQKAHERNGFMPVFNFKSELNGKLHENNLWKKVATL